MNEMSERSRQDMRNYIQSVAVERQEDVEHNRFAKVLAEQEKRKPEEYRQMVANIKKMFS